MATHTITAMFNDQASASRAAQALVSELGMDRASVRISPDAGMTDVGYDPARPHEETGFFASLKSLFLPDEDRSAYAEGMRRGRVLLSAQVDEASMERASDVLEHNGAVDLDAEEASYRQSGWTGYDSSAATTGAMTGATTAAVGTAATGAVATGAATMATANAGTARTGDDTIKVVEENLRVGKRVVERGRVRVRSYVVETPVEQQVTLRDETVHVERRPVNRPATAADLSAALQERTIEAREVDEVPVVAKEARVVEEIGLRKEAADHVETVRDTVRKTEVDVQDVSTGTGTAGTVTGGTVTGGTVTGGTNRKV